MAMQVKNPDAPATARAVNFMKSLGTERDIGMEADDFLLMFDAWVSVGALTAGFVSDRITEYLEYPKRVKDTAVFATVQPGYYTQGEGASKTFYVVVKTKDGKRVYAKMLTKVDGKWDWVYTKGAVAQFAGLTPLTIEEAAEWGRLHGQCMICHRKLTEPESVKRGIGPVCAKSISK